VEFAQLSAVLSPLHGSVEMGNLVRGTSFSTCSTAGMDREVK
jgi:hypothetical protein